MEKITDNFMGYDKMRFVYQYYKLPMVRWYQIKTNKRKLLKKKKIRFYQNKSKNNSWLSELIIYRIKSFLSEYNISCILYYILCF
jgi:hypothetical protein